MGIANELAPATSMFSGGAGVVASYAWILFVVVAVVLVVGVIVIINMFRKKKTQ